MKQYLAITLAVAAGIVLAVLVLRAADVIDGDSTTTVRDLSDETAYEQCVDDLQPWENESECR